MSREEFIETIKSKIRRGEWPPGFQIPSTSALSREYGVSDSTVYNAMLTLKDAGFVTAIKGGARYVAETETTDNVGDDTAE